MACRGRLVSDFCGTFPGRGIRKVNLHFGVWKAPGRITSPPAELTHTLERRTGTGCRTGSVRQGVLFMKRYRCAGYGGDLQGVIDQLDYLADFRDQCHLIQPGQYSHSPAPVRCAQLPSCGYFLASRPAGGCSAHRHRRSGPTRRP